MAKKVQGLSFQTEKFIIKLGIKSKVWYVALQRKSDTETVIKTFKTKKLAEAKYFQMTSIKNVTDTNGKVKPTN